MAGTSSGNEGGQLSKAPSMSIEDGTIFLMRNGKPSYFFPKSEQAAQETIEHLFGEIDKVMWKRKIKAGCWDFAAKSAIDVMLSQLDMTYCFMETPEPMEGPKWTMQEELEPATIDFWARRALPLVKKKKAADKAGAQQRRSVLGSKKPEEKGFPGAKAQVFDPLAQVPEDGRKEKIEEEYILDDEEVRYREAKLLEEKKKKDEQTKATARKKDEQMERSKVAATEEQMLKKPYTFDTEGNILWVELPNITKLPKTAVELPYKYKEDEKHAMVDLAAASPGKSPGKTSKQVTLGSAQKRKKSGFEDGFTKLPMEQPNIADIIDLKPGVKLIAAGKAKQGPIPEDETMTISGYQRLIASQEGA